MTHQTDVDVLIIGAGPTGLTLACLLAQLGVSFKLVDKKKAPSSQSKALGVQARTLELFEQLNILERVLGEGRPARGLDLIVRGDFKCRLDFTSYGQGLTDYPYILILEQDKTERILLEKLKSLGAGIQWQNELLEIQQNPRFLRATFSQLGKIESVSAKYLVAADGARSTVRALLKLPFVGGTYENRFLLADVQIKDSLSRNHITLCLSRQGFTGFFPMSGDDRFRAIGILPENFPAKSEQDFAAISGEIKKQARLDLKISDPTWTSIYRIHHRSVLRFREQRCFFAGDSAHVHSPVGAQGMNTGIQDAFNLAWKLQMVLTGKAQERLLDTYHEERFPVARKLIYTTDQIFRFILARNPLAEQARLYALPFALKAFLRIGAFRTYVFKTISQIGVGYSKSSLSGQNFLTEAEVRAGDRVPDFAIDGFFHAYMMGGPAEQEKILQLLRRYFESRVQIHTLTQGADVSLVLQEFGIFKDGLILIRPDGYAAYCAEGLDAKTLERYLSRYFIPRDFGLRRSVEDKEAFPFENFI